MPQLLGWLLDRAQIGSDCTGIFSTEAKRRHVGMGDRKTIPQPIDEPIEIQETLKATKWWGAGMRAIADRADGVALRAHLTCECMAAFRHGAVLCLTDRDLGCEQQESYCKSDHTFCPQKSSHERANCTSPSSRWSGRNGLARRYAAVRLLCARAASSRRSSQSSMLTGRPRSKRPGRSAHLRSTV